MPKITASPALPIGEMSRRTGVNIETIRYYERIGVMPEPLRTEGGHRAYDADQLKRLAFIKRSRELGFALNEIRALLGMVETGAYTCSQVHEMTTKHLAAVRKKLADLRALERVLKGMAAECSRGDVPDCPIIDALFDARMNG
ncbi:mercuric resistance operon regulatory protein [bacterium BMS3Bbin10]|nr:mercuric resistance operon regulatory protein [bacterium BMS3Bbin10]